MSNLLKTLLLSCVMLLPVSVYAGICHPAWVFYPSCSDESDGPDIGSAEWYRCQARGGCQ